MSKKPEARCPEHTDNYAYYCVLRKDHIGQCLAWEPIIRHDGSQHSIRWTKPKPKPCDRIVLVNYQLPNGPGIRYCNCTNAIGHNGPCEVRL